MTGGTRPRRNQIDTGDELSAPENRRPEIQRFWPDVRKARNVDSHSLQVLMSLGVPMVSKYRQVLQPVVGLTEIDVVNDLSPYQISADPSLYHQHMRRDVLATLFGAWMVWAVLRVVAVVRGPASILRAVLIRPAPLVTLAYTLNSSPLKSIQRRVVGCPQTRRNRLDAQLLNIVETPEFILRDIHSEPPLRSVPLNPKLY